MVPKRLADDALMIANGATMVINLTGNLNATHRYLHTMGAKTSPTESESFATSGKARQWFSETWWSEVQGFIQISEDMRRAFYLKRGPCEAHHPRKHNLESDHTASGLTICLEDKATPK